MAHEAAKHVFVSYVHEDAAQVDRLCEVLEVAQIPYWRDRSSLAPGDAWKQKIRDAIRSGSLVFLACFSSASRAREKSYMNEELTIAIEEYRQMPPDRTWIIPVRFDDGPVPEWDLRPGFTLRDINHVDLFGPKYTSGAVALTRTIASLMDGASPDPATVLAAIDELPDRDRPAMLRRMTKEMVPDPARRIELDDLVSQEAARILKAMRDEARFPTQALRGTGEDQVAATVSLAKDYWQLVEPFCWSLQVAARWADPAALQPWSDGLRSICREADRPKAGNTALIELQYIPSLAATFTAAMASVGQARWDNLKTMLIDTKVPDDRYRSSDAPIIQAVDPWDPFKRGAELTPHVLARSVIKNENPAVSLAAFTGREATKYYTPVSEWLHAVLRLVFEEQFLDDIAYDIAFDRTEAFIGLLSQDQNARHTLEFANWSLPSRSQWFGRSTWRAANGARNPVEEITEEKILYGASWAPLQAGLFGGNENRADSAIRQYTPIFERLMSARL
jgi:hypothetical protein